MQAAELNRLLARAVDDCAKRAPARNKDEHAQRVVTDVPKLRESLGLEPLPPRTELNARVTGVLERDGYRIEKIRYESRPGVLVTAHLYLPSSPGKAPLILSPHGHWKYKKAEPVVQARGIAFALAGYAVLIVDSPGYSWDQGDWNERSGMGPHDDAFLCMGVPIQGVYAWDLMRGLDYCESRTEVDATRVGITGASGGGTASIYTFALDPRIAVCVPVCAATSLETNPNNGCLCNHVPGVLNLGDRADVLALRAPAPIMLVGAAEDPEFPRAGHERTYSKLRQIYGNFRAEDAVRLEIVESGHDYNRRMREAARAFFDEHLMRKPRAAYAPELRPLTDGNLNPYPAGTEQPDAAELSVTGWHERATLTFRELLQTALRQPYPDAGGDVGRLVPWGRYGRLTLKMPGDVLAIHDAGVTPRSEGSIPIPVADLDQRLAIILGVSLSEFVAQVYHLLLPGRPEGVEAIGLGDAVIGATVQMVRGLIKGEGEPPATVIAEGPVASLAAAYLKLYRPEIAVQASHTFGGWTDLIASANPSLTQPLARYRKSDLFGAPASEGTASV